MSKGRLGILVGGGPAPGLNGVISAATIEGINQGYEVIGFRDGFKYIAQGDTTQIKPLSIRDVKDIHLKGGSILGTARTNPTVRAKTPFLTGYQVFSPRMSSSGVAGSDMRFLYHKKGKPEQSKEHFSLWL